MSDVSDRTWSHQGSVLGCYKAIAMHVALASCVLFLVVLHPSTAVQPRACAGAVCQCSVPAEGCSSGQAPRTYLLDPGNNSFLAECLQQCASNLYHDIQQVASNRLPISTGRRLWQVSLDNACVATPTTDKLLLVTFLAPPQAAIYLGNEPGPNTLWRPWLQIAECRMPASAVPTTRNMFSASSCVAAGGVRTPLTMSQRGSGGEDEGHRPNFEPLRIRLLTCPWKMPAAALSPRSNENIAHWPTAQISN